MKITPPAWRVAIALGFMVWGGLAAAQSDPPPKDAIPEKIAPGAEAQKNPPASSSSDLSKKLDKTNGVIRPSDGVDPGMAKPAPDTDPMPVVPPPAGGANPEPK